MVRPRLEVTPFIRCPICCMTSRHPVDIQYGYCAACHDWTTPRPDTFPTRPDTDYHPEDEAP